MGRPPAAHRRHAVRLGAGRWAGAGPRPGPRPAPGILRRGRRGRPGGPGRRHPRPQRPRSRRAHAAAGRGRESRASGAAMPIGWGPPHGRSCSKPCAAGRPTSFSWAMPSARPWTRFWRSSPPASTCCSTAPAGGTSTRPGRSISMTCCAASPHRDVPRKPLWAAARRYPRRPEPRAARGGLPVALPVRGELLGGRSHAHGLRVRRHRHGSRATGTPRARPRPSTCPRSSPR
jgi:hypothetical protein